MSGVRTFVQTWLLLEYYWFNGIIIFKFLEIKTIKLMFYDSRCIKFGKLFVSNVRTFYFDVKICLVDKKNSPLMEGEELSIKP